MNDWRELKIMMKALADVVRLTIVYHLARQEEITNCPHGSAGDQSTACLLASAQTTPRWLDSHTACWSPGLLCIGLSALSVLSATAGEPG